MPTSLNMEIVWHYHIIYNILYAHRTIKLHKIIFGVVYSMTFGAFFQILKPHAVIIRKEFVLDLFKIIPEHRAGLNFQALFQQHFSILSIAIPKCNCQVKVLFWGISCLCLKKKPLCQNTTKIEYQNSQQYYKRQTKGINTS